MTEQSLPEESIFLQALEIESPAERAAFLDQACGPNSQLRANVEALLRASAQSGDLLDVPDAPPATIDMPGGSEPAGTIVGPYKLLQEIGQGGMGVVYMAEQTEPVERRVALKIIKPGMDSQQVIARFEAERQALAMMDHPNIAKVLDAGTTESGRPYFVMELVKGVLVTKYCDEHHLTLKQRLELFVPVCQAIQHAHQKGIIHRDIKPTNILVALYDGAPVPKVIDFGVAKAMAQKLTEKTMFTGFGQLIGTLEYMSPEQAQFNQLDIDTRSDIYSLGVLLYELLTGTTPFDQSRFRTVAIDETLRIIREEEPPKPSTRLGSSDTLPTIAANRGIEPARLRKLVRGELDWIVMKALEKDRNRRYETANGFAADVQRYLCDEAVMAGPLSATYKLKKFLRRNKGPVLAALLVFLALVAGIVGTAWQAVRADRERLLAMEERNQKQTALGAETAARKQAMEALTSLTDSVVEQQLARQATLSQADRAFLQKILAHYEAFAALKGNTPASRAIRAEGYWRVGYLRHRLGELAEAITSAEQAVELNRQLAAEFPAVPDYRRELARSHTLLGILLREDLEDGAAVTAHRSAIAIREQLVTEYPKDALYRKHLAASYLNLAHVLDDQNKYGQAAVEIRRALILQKQLVADFPLVPGYRQQEALSHNALGIVLMELKQRAAAEDEYRQAIALQKQLAADFPEEWDYAVQLGGSYCNMSTFVGDGGKPADALDWSQQAILTLTPIVNRQPGLLIPRRFLCNSHRSRATTLEKLERFAEAIPDWDRAIELEPGTPRIDYMGSRVMCLARVEPAKAVAEAEQLPNVNLTAGTFFHMARVYAVASVHVEDEAQREQYVARGIVLLYQARDQGLFMHKSQIERAMNDTDLAPLRQRAEFKKLIAEVEGSARK